MSNQLDALTKSLVDAYASDKEAKRLYRNERDRKWRERCKAEGRSYRAKRDRNRLSQEDKVIAREKRIQVLKAWQASEAGQLYLKTVQAERMRKHATPQERVKHQRERRQERKKTSLDIALAARVSSLRCKAKRQGVPFDLDAKYLKSIFTDKCPYLGIDIVLVDKTKTASFSVDRIVPELGYVKGNVQIISNKANSMKHNASIAELLTFAMNVLKRHQAAS